MINQSKVDQHKLSACLFAFDHIGIHFGMSSANDLLIRRGAKKGTRWQTNDIK